MKPLVFSLLAILLAACQNLPPSSEADTPTPSATASPALAKPAQALPNTLESIYFDMGRIQVAVTERAKIPQVAEWAREHPDSQLLLVGYTDSLGSKGYNLAIAEQRVRAVAQLLRQHGVPPQQIRQFPVGDEGLDRQCNQEACRKKQRRVAIRRIDPLTE